MERKKIFYELISELQKYNPMIISEDIRTEVEKLKIVDIYDLKDADALKSIDIFGNILIKYQDNTFEAFQMPSEIAIIIKFLKEREK